MATAKSTPAEINEIQRRMAQIRRELHEEVREAVKGAQSLTDWRSQVRHHPWAGARRGGGGGLPDRAEAAAGPGPDDRGGHPARRGAAVPARRGARAQEETMGPDRLGRGAAGPHRGAGRAELRHPVSRAVDRRAAARGRGPRFRRRARCRARPRPGGWHRARCAAGAATRRAGRGLATSGDRSIDRRRAARPTERTRGVDNRFRTIR